MNDRGFSLLEILIVLALIGIMAAMVTPRLERSYEAVVSSGERAEVVRQLERLPVLTRASGSALLVESDDDATFAEMLDLPEGWSVRAMGPARIEASGVCRPMHLRVRGRGSDEEWTLGAPACEVVDAL